MIEIRKDRFAVAHYVFGRFIWTESANGLDIYAKFTHNIYSYLHKELSTILFRFNNIKNFPLTFKSNFLLDNSADFIRSDLNWSEDTQKSRRQIIFLTSYPGIIFLMRNIMWNKFSKRSTIFTFSITIFFYVTLLLQNLNSNT